MSSFDRITKIDISSSTIFRTVLILVGFWFLYIIADLLIMLFAAVVVASAVRPVADKLERYRVPRALSVVLVYIVFILALSGVVTLMIDPVTEQTRQLIQALPQLLERIGALSYWQTLNVSDLVGNVERALVGSSESLANVGANVFRQTQIFFSSIFTVLFVFVIALYLVVDKDALKKPFRLLVPAEHLPYTESVVERAQQKIGRWVLAQLALAVIIGTVVSGGLWLLGLKYALVLGLLAGVFELLPVIGPILAAVPAVLVGFAQSAWLGLAVLVFYILVQQAENNLLIPVIMRKATGLNPLITLLAVLLGARLAGFVGVMLAVPAAAVLSAFFSDVAGKDESDELAG